MKLVSRNWGITVNCFGRPLLFNLTNDDVKNNVTNKLFVAGNKIFLHLASWFMFIT